ncbi:putative methyltransferase type 11 [Rosellinia necatrix]|uniref:Putative methyltransferase type 11 n=1 Tax=Rosellinia necatrix TaxID=77044 RepID=A0A1W2TJT6_ROSNE|nr:putative methyltransferase type 11 [Rosellinia necatrix]
MASDEALAELAEPGYWDARYDEAEPGKPLHEWFRSFADIEEFLKRSLFQVYPAESNPRILHLGSGDSTVPEDLAKCGYRNQLCVDFSAVVIKMMTQQHAEIKGIEWQQMDIRQMDKIPSQSIDVAFDKATLDAMIHGSPWTPPPDVVDNTGRYMRELTRVLKPTGIFIYITYRQPHFLRPLLNCEGTNWDIDIETLGKLDSSFSYYGFTCTLAGTRDAGKTS